MMMMTGVAATLAREIDGRVPEAPTHHRAEARAFSGQKFAETLRLTYIGLYPRQDDAQ